jgi:hypothetical protein
VTMLPSLVLVYTNLSTRRREEDASEPMPIST